MNQLTDADFGLAAAEGQVRRPVPRTEKPKGMLVPTKPEVIPEAIEEYTPDAMVNLMIAKPRYTHKQYAHHFGRSLSWFHQVLASEVFIKAMEPRKHEILDPFITSSMDERFKGLALHALSVIGDKLEGKEVSEFLATKAADIGVRALGMGNAAVVVPTSAVAIGANAVADRITAAMEAAAERSRMNSGAIDVEAKPVRVDSNEPKEPRDKLTELENGGY